MARFNLYDAVDQTLDFIKDISSSASDEDYLDFLVALTEELAGHAEELVGEEEDEDDSDELEDDDESEEDDDLDDETDLDDADSELDVTPAKKVD